jgi:hypothetical protein
MFDDDFVRFVKLEEGLVLPADFFKLDNYCLRKSVLSVSLPMDSYEGFTPPLMVGLISYCRLRKLFSSS